MTEPVTAADVVENLEAPVWMSSEAAYGYGCGVSAAMRALREACGGGDIVIRTDGTLATLDHAAYGRRQPMTDPWYVVALRVSDLVHMATPVLDLPDAEHVHVTRHPDGTIKSAVPMERAELGYSYVNDTMEVWLESAVLPYSCMVDLWVDCPTGGDQ